MFDYANLDRPIVVYADDWEVYRELRGVYFDLMETAPGRVTRTISCSSWLSTLSSALLAIDMACSFDNYAALARSPVRAASAMAT